MWGCQTHFHPGTYKHYIYYIFLFILIFHCCPFPIILDIFSHPGRLDLGMFSIKQLDFLMLFKDVSPLIRKASSVPRFSVGNTGI